MIQEHQLYFRIFTELSLDKQINKLAVERHIDGKKESKINGETAKGISSFAELLPVHYIGVDSHRYFYDGSKPRRQFLDWGVFHVERSFLQKWREYDLALKQRNAALKAKRSRAEIESWNEPIISFSLEISGYRVEYFRRFQEHFQKIINLFLPQYQIDLKYHAGWDGDLVKMLKDRFFSDLQKGYTSCGAHRADLQVGVNGKPAEVILSQGQQKLAAYALKLAQGDLLQQLTQQEPLFLIDDLPSELDKKNQDIVSHFLASFPAQIFITSTELAADNSIQQYQPSILALN